MYKCKKKKVNTPDGAGQRVTYHLAFVKVLAIFKVDAKEVDQEGMKWKSAEEFGLSSNPNTLHRRNYNV